MYTHLYEILADRAARFPDAVALGSQRGLVWERVTGRELLARVDQLAAELAGAGVDGPDRGAGGDLLYFWYDRHAQGVHDHPRQPLLAGRRAARQHPARPDVPAGQHPPAVAPVRADLWPALPAGGRSRDPLR